MGRRMKIAVLMSVDSLIIIFSAMLSYIFIESYATVSLRFVLYQVVVSWVAYIVLGSVLNVFNRINRYTGLNAIISIFTTLTIVLAFELVIFVMLDVFNTEVLVAQIVSSYFLSLALIIGSRIIWRVIVDQSPWARENISVKKKMENVLILGAGDGGELLFNALRKHQQQCKIVGFLDDDPNKVGMVLGGKKVLGTFGALPELVSDYEVDKLIVAIPSMTAKQYERLLDITNPLDVELSSMPSIEELSMNGNTSPAQLREIDVVDLLGRDEIKLDVDAIKQQVTGETVMVTGAGGSIGSEICRQVMMFSPERIILLGHGENSIYQIHRELQQTFREKNTELVPVIADIQDRHRLDDIIGKYQPKIIYHAAAHKHVPLMEYNPSEAVKNNIFGTKNVAEMALKHQVQSFVMISTDKAVNPPNVMGATKRIAEMIVTGLNKHGVTKFSAVRFGNVLGSRGSVVPIFKEQVAKGGEIFILDMGEPVKIVDLAKKIIKLSGHSEHEIRIVESGIRPGEKLYEELLVDKERSPEQIHDKIFVGTVNGFSYEEVIEKVTDLPVSDQELAKELIAYAKKSSEG
ncbi:polysaccharide biosynthesis protein [Vagococcus penaei]|uniref:Polysaccharide biosynthesis protein n=1 Tax=Vagococcus penaei TaxID=633807 RepID=A0A1Q2D3Y0_9ENTE|nr:nucleoside-diphosphate sugar epimerase/dehydratase [Vagococcus penaei]AQP53100.1 polysaccharide biosynthesis protein [Vagococcus penaei]RSU06038.1 polysaccharide biosynthesis protein [Vagococcus penaei]